MNKSSSKDPELPSSACDFLRPARVLEDLGHDVQSSHHLLQYILSHALLYMINSSRDGNEMLSYPSEEPHVDGIERDVGASRSFIALLHRRHERSYIVQYPR